MKNYTLVSGSYLSAARPYNQFTRLWQASEAYLDVGAKRYRVSDLHKLELSEDRCSYTTTSDILLRILKVVSYIPLFPLALGALAIRCYYRSKWRCTEHIKAYENTSFSTFELLPKGTPIPSQATLFAQQQARQKPPAPPPPAPAPAPVPSVVPLWDPLEFSEPLPPFPPAAQAAASQVALLGTQVAGNDVVRVLEPGAGSSFFSTATRVSDQNGQPHLYVPGNGVGLLIRLN